MELTKQFEKTHRGTLSQLVAQFKDKTVLGEITVVIVGNHPKFMAQDQALDHEEEE